MKKTRVEHGAGDMAGLGVDDHLLTAEEVGAVYRISTRQVWKLIEIGSIPAPIKLGRSTRWRASDIQAALRKLRSAESS